MASAACNHGGDAGLHVADAAAEYAVAFDGGSPGVSVPAHCEGVHVYVAVEHEGLAAAAAFEGGDGLESAGVYFLEFYGVAAGLQEFGQEAGQV